MMATIAANPGLLPKQAWSRLLVASALSMLLHLAVLLGISVNPTGGVVNVVSTITARLEQVAPDTGPETVRAGLEQSSTPDSERDRQKSAETRTEADRQPELKAANPAASCA